MISLNYETQKRIFRPDEESNAVAFVIAADGTFAAVTATRVRIGNGGLSASDLRTIEEVGATANFTTWQDYAHPLEKIDLMIGQGLVARRPWGYVLDGLGRGRKLGAFDQARGVLDERQLDRGYAFDGPDAGKGLGIYDRVSGELLAESRGEVWRAIAAADQLEGNEVVICQADFLLSEQQLDHSRRRLSPLAV